MPRQIVTELVADPTKFRKGMDQAESSAGRFGEHAKQGFGLGVGLKIMDLASSAIGDLSGQILASADAAREDAREQVMLAASLKNNVPAWDGNTTSVEAYVTAQQALGFSDGEVRDSVAKLVGVTHDLTKAQELNGMAQDLARAKGLDLASATNIITKAQQGNGKALKGLGVDIAGAKTATEMLAAVTRNANGAALVWAGTSEGRQRTAQIRQAEAWETIGKTVAKLEDVFLPLLATAFEQVADAVDTVSNAIQTVPTPVVFGALAVAVWALVPPTAAWAAAMVTGAVAMVVALSPIEIVIAAIGVAVAAAVLVFSNLGNALNVFSGKLPDTAKSVDSVSKSVRTMGAAVEEEARRTGKSTGSIARSLNSAAAAAEEEARRTVKAAKNAADTTAVDVQRRITSYRELAQYLLGKFNQDVGDALAIEDARDTLSADTAEANALRKKIASGTLTASEQVDARARIDALGDEQIQKLSILDGFSALGAADARQMGALLLGKVASTSGAEKTMWAAALADWNAHKAAVEKTIKTKLEMRIEAYVNGQKVIGPVAMASGGVSKGGLTLVGEEGPELVNLPSGARVYSNAETAAMASPVLGAPTARPEVRDIHIHINGGLIDGPTIDALTNALARRLRYARGT